MTTSTTHKGPTALDHLRRLWDPVQLQLWLRESRGQHGAAIYGRRQLAIFLLTVRRLRDDEISRQAAALTYYTLLSLVPLLAVGFALFKAFGGLRALEGPLRQFVVDNLAPAQQAEVGLWLDRFLTSINAGAIAGVGVLILFYSAVGLLSSVEQSFNRIWGIQRVRALPIRFAIYWCLITLAPPLIGVSLSISAQLQRSSFVTAVTHWLPFGLGRWLVSGAGLVSVCLAYFLIFLIVPNIRVRWRSALVGGLVAGLLWSGCKVLFVWASAGSAKQSAVYGALSALPLLILWLYYSWVITLFGVTFTFANQMINSDAPLQPYGVTPTAAFREQLLVRLTVEVADDFAAGKPAPTAAELADRAGTMLSVVLPALDLLVEQHVLTEVQPEGYVLARAAETLHLEDVVRVARERAGTPLELGAPREGAVSEAHRLLGEADAARYAALGAADLAHLTVSQQKPGEPPTRGA
ncbi:MAG: YihY family inner membrane protein [Deltaproteobacteria bacterium]|nr:YihY family inner membrane protein [Deltaproteobacteria bacterium]